MNVTEEDIKKYIEAFHRALDEVSSNFFNVVQANNLLHKSLLPAKITCYISTQFGVAIEYISDSVTTIETVRGSARVEDLLVKAVNRIRNIGPMFNIGGSGTHISKLTLADGFPFRLSNPQASVTFQEVRFSADALNWRREIEYAEVYGDRSKSKWSIEAAQSRAKDEVLAAIFIAQQAKEYELSLHDYMKSFREKNILVLGAYDNEGEKRISAICESLRKNGYNPILIKDIPDFEHYDLSQKVTVVGALSRFIIIDDSAPSGHLTEIEVCKHNRWVTILLRANGRGASWMSAGASITSNVILEKDYDPENPDDTVSEATRWAESKLDDLKVKMNELYPWRT